ncbi:hypothetical protein [Hydrogenophaga sp. BPS33]|uniref:hypothetical protein n=1 Tax=Hydrogenophaga sp. BPS33 TaxID=2651974 RepID=UPI00131F90E0|nr:hypothetical protein [Hydrogenophaga sp. BPS33]QHE88533.1 hypothetical protein F9K07_28450 [Hydrogenophaga sp. BPS33]
MSTPKRPLFCALTVSALLLTPMSSMGESALTTQGSASASLQLRIIIPPVMRVMENSHPQLLDTSVGGEASAEQRLVVQSNMKRGFCVSLRRAAPQLGAWDLQTTPQSGVQLSALPDGYRVCGTRPGHYTLVLQHRFAISERHIEALRWPVQTDISAI